MVGRVGGEGRVQQVWQLKTTVVRLATAVQLVRQGNLMQWWLTQQLQGAVLEVPVCQLPEVVSQSVIGQRCQWHCRHHPLVLFVHEVPHPGASIPQHQSQGGQFGPPAVHPFAKLQVALMADRGKCLNLPMQDTAEPLALTCRNGLGVIQVINRLPACCCVRSNC